MRVETHDGGCWVNSVWLGTRTALNPLTNLSSIIFTTHRHPQKGVVTVSNCRIERSSPDLERLPAAKQWPKKDHTSKKAKRRKRRSKHTALVRPCKGRAACATLTHRQVPARPSRIIRWPRCSRHDRWISYSGCPCCTESGKGAALVSWHGQGAFFGGRV